MVNLASVFCAKRKDNVFNPDEHVGIRRARARTHTYAHAGSDGPEIFECVNVIPSEGR